MLKFVIRINTFECLLKISGLSPGSSVCCISSLSLKINSSNCACFIVENRNVLSSYSQPSVLPLSLTIMLVPVVWRVSFFIFFFLFFFFGNKNLSCIPINFKLSL